MFEEFGLETCNLITLPMMLGLKLTFDMWPQNEHSNVLKNSWKVELLHLNMIGHIFFVNEVNIISNPP
jgi:hypothetical protein